MCGIAGYAGDRGLEDERIDACLALMGRRGPDARAAQTWITSTGRHTTLLASRLAIIDLDPSANQPMTSGAHSVVFNGELYNYVEIRESVLTGYARDATSDTRVLLEAIRTKGWGVLDQLEGMWAFGVYDEGDGSLTLCRDRFGEKPLWVLRDGTSFYFGSEPKLIAALSGRRLKPDLTQVKRYLVNGYRALYSDRTRSWFAEVEALEPGTTLRILTSGQSTVACYWRPTFNQDGGLAHGQAVEGVRDRLIRSTELRLRADVPLAFCMSGGVDSNALISIARRVLDYDVHGFTIRNTDERYDEQELVETAVDALKIHHTWVPTERQGFLSRMRDLVTYHDAPVSTISYYVHWLLAQQIASRGYRVAISGTAADELFSGYYDHHLAYLREVTGDAALHASALAAWREHVLPSVRNPYLQDPDLFVTTPDFRDHLVLGSDEFSSWLTDDWTEPFAETAYSGDVLRSRMANELFHESVPVILYEDDLNSMYWSVENRSPFLDRALFDFAGTIPTTLLVRDARAKAILRDAMRGIVPDAILDSRRKVGFNAPVDDLLDRHDPPTRSALLEDSPVFDVVRRDAVEALLDAGPLPNSRSKFLFSFVSVKFFLEAFL